MHKKVKYKSQFSGVLEIMQLVLENLPCLFFFASLLNLPSPVDTDKD